MLPVGADPMDIRYNVVQWVNRNERGWSVGGNSQAAEVVNDHLRAAGPVVSA